MPDEIKKKKVDKLLEAIRSAAHTLIDLGSKDDPSYIVMNTALDAYEFEMMKEYAKWYTVDDKKTDNVLDFTIGKENKNDHKNSLF